MGNIGKGVFPLDQFAQRLKPCTVARAQQATQRYLESGGYFLLDLFNSFEVG